MNQKWVVFVYEDNKPFIRALRVLSHLSFQGFILKVLWSDANRGNSKLTMPSSNMKMITMPKCSVTNDSLIIEFLASVNESLKLWFVSKPSKLRIITRIGSTGTSLPFGSSKQSCAFWYIVLYQFYYIIYWGYIFLRRKYYFSLRFHW